MTRAFFISGFVLLCVIIPAPLKADLPQDPAARTFIPLPKHYTALSRKGPAAMPPIRNVDRRAPRPAEVPASPAAMKAAAAPMTREQAQLLLSIFGEMQ